MANLLDAADDVVFWVRLQRNDLPILWSEGGREYTPTSSRWKPPQRAGLTGWCGAHWVVEVKRDTDMQTADVVGKRDAARR